MVKLHNAVITLIKHCNNDNAHMILQILKMIMLIHIIICVSCSAGGLRQEVPALQLQHNVKYTVEYNVKYNGLNTVLRYI